MAESLLIDIKARDSSAAAFQSLNRNMGSVSNSMSKLSSALGLIARGSVIGAVIQIIKESIGPIIEYSDAWTLMQNRLRSAGLTATQTAVAQTKIAEIASKTRSDLTETANLYARVAFATENMGVKQSDVAKVTETLSMAFKMSGKTALEAQSAVTQFTQALSSGVLQGDELRSLRENAPEVARAIANAFGTTVGGLKQLGAEGALTSDKIFQAILDVAPQIEARFKTTQRTWSDTWTAMTNNVQLAIGRIQDLFAQNPLIIDALKLQIEKERELKSSIEATSKAQQDLSDAQQAENATAVVTAYNEATKALWEQKDAAIALLKSFQDAQQFSPFSETEVEFQKYSEGLDLLGTMINGTGEEAYKASLRLTEMMTADPELFKSIEGINQYARAVMGLQSKAEEAKAKLNELSNTVPTQVMGPIIDNQKKILESYGIPEEVINRNRIASEEYVRNRYAEIAADERKKLIMDELKKNKDINLEQATGLADSIIKRKQEEEALKKSTEAGRKYSEQIDDIIQKYREEADPLLKYREHLALIDEAYAKGRISAETYAETIANIKKAMEKAAENADPLKKQTDELTRAFEGFGRRSADAIAEFVVSGKGDFKDLIQSMIKELISFMLYQNVFKSLFGSFADGGGFDIAKILGFKAVGGSVSSNSPYIVGERGPELFIPNRSGSIVPNSGLDGGGGSGGVTVNVINNSNSQATTRESVDGRGNRKIDVVIGDIVSKQIGQIGSSVNNSIRQTFNTAPALVGR